MYLTRCSGEVALHVVAGHDVVAAETGEVFGDDHVDPLRLYVGYHALKIRPVEIGAAPAVVYVGVVDIEPLLPHEFPQQGFLVRDALRRPFVLILL